MTTTTHDSPDLATEQPTPLGLIGGIGLTEVRVYAQRAAPDGCFSGCPHVHAITDEAYFVLEGRGSVEFHELASGYRAVALSPGQYLHFPPMVLHRLISGGDLVILGMMANAGLAERGEARIYFGAEVDTDRSRFDELMSLPRRLGLEGALQRRDASVRAYQQLMQLWNDDRDAYFAELRRFFTAHCQAMAARARELETIVRRGPIAWGELALARLRTLPELPATPVDIRVDPCVADAAPALGMCGLLRPIVSLQTL